MGMILSVTVSQKVNNSVMTTSQHVNDSVKGDQSKWQ